MLQIRKAYPTDAYTIINVLDMVWKSTYYDVLPNGILHHMLQNVDGRIQHLKDQIEENNRIFVALEDEKMIGFVFYAKTHSTVYVSSAEIRELYVLPDYQRQGIGTKLFQMAVSELRKLGYRSVVVNCPSQGTSVEFFAKLGGIQKETISKKIYGYSVFCDLIYFDLEQENKEEMSSEWNDLFLLAQEHLTLLNDIHREIAVILTEHKKVFLGIGIKNKVCPIESALANMYLGQESHILKILILDKKSKPVLPCGRCRDLLISLGQESAQILFDIGTLKTITMKELNPYYKDEEKI